MKLKSLRPNWKKSGECLLLRIGTQFSFLLGSKPLARRFSAYLPRASKALGNRGRFPLRMVFNTALEHFPLTPDHIPPQRSSFLPLVA